MVAFEADAPCSASKMPGDRSAITSDESNTKTLRRKAKIAKSGHLVDPARLDEVETEVIAYRHEEGKLLSTLAHCLHCAAAKNRFGGHHPNKVIAESGLSNIQGVQGSGHSAAEAAAL